jgi:hypothetical protein
VNPVLKATHPWEAKQNGTSPVDPGFPQSGNAIGYAQPFSGGIWFDEERDLYRAWYVCGPMAEEAAPNVGGCCYAESVDGLKWDKPIVNSTTQTNVVLYSAFDGNTVWLDHYTADPSERWKMATVPLANHFGAYQLFTSREGIEWKMRVAKTGPTSDRATIFYNPFRHKWVYSIKSGFAKTGRSRSYLEVDDLIADAHWSSSDPLPWTSADSADPPNPYGCAGKPAPCSSHAELYNLDAAAYESVMVGLFSIFRGFVNPSGGGDTTHRTSGEWNEVYLGFSRGALHEDIHTYFYRTIANRARAQTERTTLLVSDGYHWHRPTPREAFLKQSWPLHGWNNNDVQSAGGGFVMAGDLLRFYASGRKVTV